MVHTNPTLVQRLAVLGRRVPAFPVVVEEEVRQDRLGLLVAQLQQTVGEEEVVQQPGVALDHPVEVVAQEIPAVVLEDIPMDKAG